MRQSPLDFLPLKDLTYRILIALADGERHGWSLVQSLDEAPHGPRLLPGHLYRTLDRMLEDGLIDERDQPLQAKPAGARGAAPSRFFRLTPLGRDVARAETRRLEALVGKAGRLLRDRR